jgi:hypothetical protein
MPTNRISHSDCGWEHESHRRSSASCRALKHRYVACFGLLALSFANTAPRCAQQPYPGIWAGRDLKSLPLPVMGYQVYMMGETHGAKENADLFGQYLGMLAAGAGLRDVAIEEDLVYERPAQAYVDGKENALPEGLCLRANLLDVVRRFNQGRREDERIRVHLPDIDTPGAVIRSHLLAIQLEVPASAAIQVPEAADIKERGLKTVEHLRRLTPDARLRSELRTVEHSIRAYQQGLEVGTTGQFKGSPYLDDREEAIFLNIQELVRERRPVLVLYGSDHVSKSRRKDGGPNRDQEFSPVALRLDQAGVKVYSLVTSPLAGSVHWRTGDFELPYTAKDGSIESRETLDHVLASLPPRTLLYVDPRQNRIKLPSQDLTAMSVDGFLLFPFATPMENRCPVR